MQLNEDIENMLRSMAVCHLLKNWEIDMLKN